MIVISKANKESRPKESGEECFNLQLLRKKSKEQKGESSPVSTLCISLSPLPHPLALTRILHASCSATSSKATTRTHPLCIGDSATGPHPPPPPPTSTRSAVAVINKDHTFWQESKGDHPSAAAQSQSPSQSTQLMLAIPGFHGLIICEVGWGGRGALESRGGKAVKLARVT